MADTPPAPSSGTSTPSSATDQARIRKERREAKIRAGGSARLNKITGLGGGIQRDAPAQPAPPSHGDPDEVDISQHYYEPSRPLSRNNASPSPNPQQQAMNDDAIRQMMLGFDPSGAPPPGANSFAGFPGMGGPPGMGMPGMDGSGGEDPMMKMLQQMMGGVPGEGAGGMPNFPGMGGMPGMPAMPGQQAAPPADPYAYLWRIVHAIFALSLGLYIAFTTTFTGTKLERERSGFTYAPSGEQTGLSPSSIHFFWIFATAQVLLQSSRFFLEKGKVQPAGIMGTVMGFLPEPWKGYLQIILRYARIWTTVSGDAMVCVFVLGVCAWLRT